MDIHAYRTVHKRMNGDFLTLYYCLEGTCILEEKDQKVILPAQGVYVLNPGEEHLMECSQSLVVQLNFPARLMLSADGQEEKYVRCSSLEDDSKNMDRLRQILDRLLEIEEDSSVAMLQKERLQYDLLIFLLSFFSHNSRYVSEALDRRQQIERYLRLHFQEELPLEQTAGQFGLSPAYFSRFFKDSFGATFMKYLAQIRAASTLSFLESDSRSILEIGLEAGFPNINAYNTAFKTSYGITPGAWRKQALQKNQEELADMASVRAHLKQTEKEEETAMISCCCSLQADAPELNPFWFKLLNIGSVFDLLTEKNQRMLREIAQDLPFENGRLLLELPREMKNLSFEREELVLDYLYHIELNPWIVLDFRQCQQRDFGITWFARFLAYFSNRYGSKVLKNWHFEVFYNSDFREHGSEKYDAFCQKINGCLQRMELNRRVYGPGLQMDANLESLENFCKYNTQIETLTITLSPLVFNHDRGTIYMERKTSSDWFLKAMEKAQTLAGQYGIRQVLPISWKDSLYDQDILNDSSYRAARLIQAYLMTYGKMAALPIETPFHMAGISAGIFAGDAGLLSPKDIRKPAYYAMKFLKHLDKSVDFVNEHLIISSSPPRYLQIIMHNCAGLSYQYYVEEGYQKESQILEYFEQTKPLQFHIEVDGMDQGTYIVKEKTIGMESGNAYSKYGRINFEDSSFFGPNELRFLQAASIPAITGYRTRCEGKMVLDLTLQPNEVRHLHIVYAQADF